MTETTHAIISADLLALHVQHDTGGKFFVGLLPEDDLEMTIVPSLFLRSGVK